ncbi:MAG: dihydropteroate synthase [Actinobacteria bacterium]|nr:dihydropteroate synthase [Actinomycetota bacterium]
MKSKMRHLVVSVENIQARATHILKQVMLSRGGECATPREVYLLTNEPVKVVMMGTVNQFRDAIINLRLQPFGLSRLAAELQELIDGAGSGVTGMRTIEAGRHSLTVGGRTLVMGILNVTPDSFSDGGMYNSLDEAVSRAHEMVEAGVDIIDIGGESTRPGSEPVPPDEELRRTIPVIKAIASEIEVPISIDTCKSAVASEALDAGAVMVNDISGLRMDPEMVALVSEADVPVVVMHMQGVPQNMQDNPEYGDVVQDIARFLREQASVAVAGGISREKIIIDPGIGFGKTLDHNLEIIRRLDEFKSIGYPVLCGPSRKKFIGAVLGRETDQRVFGTAATVAFAVDRGADMVRLHDIEEVLDVVKMSDALAGRDEGAAVSTALSRPDRP